MADTYSHYSQTVEHYRRYRPHYPQPLLAWLKTECGLLPTHPIADVGSGTGLLTERLLENGNPVYAVEPSDDMRLAAEEALRANPRFTSVAATAEATTLADHSVYLVAVGNAFHWFNHDTTRQEFLRILQPHGWVVLLWNLERNNGTPFAVAFERFWQTHIDPAAKFTPFHERKSPNYIPKFFGADNFKKHSLDNYQVCDFEALTGVVRSTLKAPKADDPRYPAMVADLQALFDQHQVDGTVTLEYDTAIIYGQLAV